MDRASPPPKSTSAKVAFSPNKRRAQGGSIKGKERALEDNSWPGDITYRHLIGGNGVVGTSNPLRCVAHIDIDAAYAAMEMARLKIDPNTPLAVQQWQGLIAVNYPARKFGITRHESPDSAKLKCPDLVMVHCASYRAGDTEPGNWPDAKPATHKISLDHYRRESLKIIKIVQESCTVVEKASIDESYLDLSLPVRDVLLARYPSLATLPLGADLDTPLPMPETLGVKLDWEVAGNVVPVASAEGHDDDEASLSQERAGLSWSDVALFCAAEIVMKCRKEVHERLGYTCSAGVAPNKMLAKLCSAWKKPNAQTILRFSAVAGFLYPMKFQKIRNLGGKLGNTIKEAWEAETVADLLKIPLNDMQAVLGEESGMWLWEIARGLDQSEVEIKSSVKSMISSKNFRPSISSYKEALHWIHIMATELHLRLSEARETAPSLWPKTVALHVRSEGYVIRSHQQPFPFTSNFDIAYIEKFGIKLVRIAIGERDSWDDNTRLGPWNNLQLSLTSLERLEKGQSGLHAFLKAAPAPSTISQDSPVDQPTAREPPSLRRKLSAQPPASTSKSSTSTSRLPPPEPKPGPPPSLANKRKVEVVRTSSASAIKKKKASSSFKCPRCALPVPVEGTDEASFRRARDEHTDYHFARDLLEKERAKGREPARSLLAPAATAVEKQPGRAKAKPADEAANGRQRTLAGFFGKPK